VNGNWLNLDYSSQKTSFYEVDAFFWFRLSSLDDCCSLIRTFSDSLPWFLNSLCWYIMTTLKPWLTMKRSASQKTSFWVLAKSGDEIGGNQKLSLVGMRASGKTRFSYQCLHLNNDDDEEFLSLFANCNPSCLIGKRMKNTSKQLLLQSKCPQSHLGRTTLSICKYGTVQE